MHNHLIFYRGNESAAGRVSIEPETEEKAKRYNQLDIYFH